MKYELKCVDDSMLSIEEKTEINQEIDRIIERHKNNRYQINRLTFESTAALTASENLIEKKASQGFLRRFWNNLTGKNNRIQAEIDRNIARAQYASQQTLQKLAEQNLMSFELITAVNNKLNASMIAVEKEINNVYDTILTLFKHSRAEIMQLETRVERLERNVDLLNWQNSIEYQMYNGIEYQDLDDVTKLVCVAHDFFSITKGAWGTADLLLLKSAMGLIGIDPRKLISYEKFIREVGNDGELFSYLVGDGGLVDYKSINDLDVIIKAISKVRRLKMEEQHAVDYMIDFLKQYGVDKEFEDVAYEMMAMDLKKEDDINLETKVGMYELEVEILYDLWQLYEHSKLPEKLFEAKMLFFNSKPNVVSQLDDLAYAGVKEAAYMYMMIYNVSSFFDYNDHDDLYKDKSDEGYTRRYNRFKDLYYSYKAEDVIIRFLGLYYHLHENYNIKEFNKDYNVLRRMALAGDVYAQLTIGVFEGNSCTYYILDDGTEVYKDLKEAVRYLKMAAEQGASCANRFIMELYTYDIDDCDEKLEFYQKMAELNNGKAMCQLGYMYYDGRWVNEDKSKAVYYYEKAYENGYYESRMLNDIACYYSNAGDNEKALKWWHKGENDSSSCVANLGWSYRYGNGVQIDYQKALEYYKRAAKWENGYAARNIAEMYLNGIGVCVDRSEAISWYEKAATFGDEVAKKWLSENT